jgi:hypothetical protein
MELMNGSQFAKDYVNEYLKDDFPIRLINYRNGWEVDDITLPTPVSFFTYEPLAMDAWPTIITVVMSTNKLERIGHTGSDPLYRVNYSMRTYVWVRDENSEPTTRMRDRLTTVLRSSLMDYPCLKTYDDRQSFRIQIDEGSIQEQFSDLTLLKGDRVLAGAYISYDLAIDEVITRMPIAPSANEINTTVSTYSLTSEQ